MIDNVPLIQNANDVQQINASIIAMKKASRELDEKIAQFNKLLSQEITNREKAITEAINSLDVPSVGGSGKYISAISETDGKISATASDITSTVSSGNSQPVTSGGVADTLNNPVIKTFSNNVSTNKIIHLGRFYNTTYSGRCGLICEVEAKCADGCIKFTASITSGNIGLTRPSNTPYTQIYLYKTDNYTFDLYLFIGSYVEEVYVKLTQPLYFTYDGSVVTSYTGTKIDAFYTLSSSGISTTPTSGNNDPITSDGVYNALVTKANILKTSRETTIDKVYEKLDGNNIYLKNGMNQIAQNIANYTTGQFVNINTGGPLYCFVIYKLDNTYWSAELRSYQSAYNNIVFKFGHENTGYYGVKIY